MADSHRASSGATRGIARMLVGRVSALGIQFVALALLGRALGPSDFGVLQLAVVVLAYLAFAADLGLSVLGARDFAEPTYHRPTIGEYVGTRAVLTAIVVLATIALALILGLSSRNVSIVVIMSLGLAASAFNLRWLLQARQQFTFIAISDTVAALAQLVSALALVRAGGGLVWAAATISISPIVSTVLTAFFARPGRSAIPRLGVVGINIVRRALPLGVAVFATSVYFNIDSLLLGIFRGTAEVGYYGAAYRIVFASLVLSVVANAVALPVITRLLGEDREAVPATLLSLSSVLLVFALPIAVGTTLTAPLIISITYGPEFAAGAVPLSILIWTCVTVAANTPFAALMLARRQDRSYLTLTVAGVAFNVVANLVAIPIAGMVGAGLTTIATEVIVLSLVIARTADVSPRILLSSFRSSMLPAVVMALVVLPVRNEYVAIPIGIFAFGITALWTGALRVRSLRALFVSDRGEPTRVD